MYYVSVCPDTERVFVCIEGQDNNVAEFSGESRSAKAYRFCQTMNERSARLENLKVEIRARQEGRERVYDLLVNGRIKMEGESFTVVSQVQQQLIDSVDFWPSETSEVAQKILSEL